MRIGLTGGIAAGKSTVAARLRNLGACVIDYDALAHAVVEPGGVALPRIARAFGKDALNPDGTLNRAWLAEHVFGPSAEPGARERLNSIEHPLVYREAERIEQEESSEHPHAVIVHDVPLLAEVIGTIPFRFDRIVTVEAPEETRIARMMATRGMTRDQACDRIRNQSSSEERLAIASDVIDSTQPLEQMFEQVDRLYSQWNNA
ncbi:dephospho-CoA kinase [Bifidobacterium sp. 64T4]|uniref:dephospho-CoA kinase n=1 Tax=Bifidobacterium pongonis TaxID=2834432 RepID=UPI001C5739E8|nr:dephospho-CoA kinase [Bifidobacterium pongonis]MBW3094993.1 dephospho-CoA kinase [Bifidobacterium pongonis]